tara:strand:- start:347 stop:1129 length:783 start_codon:yes stop_codon:yes gene_type:complete
MPSIPDLTVRPLRDTSIQPIHGWVAVPPVVNAVSPPVTLNLGTPIIQIPGCVKAHPTSDKSNKIKEDDPKGVRVYCDANQPTFTPLDYTPENLIYQRPAGFAGYKGSKSRSTDEVKKDVATSTPPITPPDKTINSAGDEKNKEEESAPICGEGYNLVDSKCVEIAAEVKAEISFIDKYLPTLPQTTTTATIAVVATTSALMAKPLADLLLKLVKPTVKKIMKKIAALKGQSPKVESVLQRRLAQRDRNRAIRALRVALKK